MGNLGPWQLVIILAIVVLLFGAKRLPQVARGVGQSLKIFRSETQGLMGDDDDAPAKASGEGAKGQTTAQGQREVEATPAAPPQPAQPVHNPVSEGVADQQRDA
jgi:sec-independent protein translocase protein TatA